MTLFDSELQVRPRSKPEIAKLMDLVRALRRETEEADEPDFATEILAAGLATHEGVLADELRSAELLASRNDLEIAIDGQPVQGHNIQASTLGMFLERIQNLVNALAQVVKSEPTQRAPLPGKILEANRLFVTGWRPGSFAVGLRFQEPLELGKLVEPEMRLPPEVLETVLGNEQLEGENLQIISSSRVRKHYSSLMQAIVREGAMVKVRSRTRPAGFRISAESARRRLDWLDQVEATDENLVVTGALTGGSVETQRFEVTTDDAVYRGRCSEMAAESMRTLHFGETVTAHLVATTVVHGDTGDESTVTHFLTRVEQAS